VCGVIDDFVLRKNLIEVFVADPMVHADAADTPGSGATLGGFGGVP
jgi:hypothetical protein